MTVWISEDGYTAELPSELNPETLREALEKIRDFDAYQGGPIALRETPTTQAMRNIAIEAVGQKSQ